ncbi:hypothetical protein VTO73DRAFT_4722 [Trametes versicolor]
MPTIRGQGWPGGGQRDYIHLVAGRRRKRSNDQSECSAPSKSDAIPEGHRRVCSRTMELQPPGSLLAFVFTFTSQVR